MSEAFGPDSQWPPIGCPPLAWPEVLDQASRQVWYLKVIEAYAALWSEHVNEPHISPVSEGAIVELEKKIHCVLPTPLRDYHKNIGALSLAEILCSVASGPTPIQPLLEAFPGIIELVQQESDLILAQKLIVFGDYLGNGNLFCFHKLTGEVYYFDHDDGDLMTRFFSSVDQYLDALMILCLAEVHENEEAGEDLLVERFGPNLIKKWRY